MHVQIYLSAKHECQSCFTRIAKKRKSLKQTGYQQIVSVRLLLGTVQACCGCSDHQAGQAQQVP